MARLVMTFKRAGALWGAAAALAGSAVVLIASPRPAFARQAIKTENVGAAENEAGNLVADAVRAAVGSDIAVIPSAAFKPGASVPRAATGEQAAGLVEPASDVIVVLSLRGAQVLAALEFSVSFAPQKSAGFLQVSGLRFVYDPARPGGKRVSSVTVNGAPLDAVKTYKVATTRPLANGQQGYFNIWEKDQITVDSSKTLAAALIELAKARGGTLSPTVEGRITVAK